MKLILLFALISVPALASDTWYNLVLPNTVTANSNTAVPPQTLQVGGSDGTNLRPIKTSSTGVVAVDGSAVTQPVSISGSQSVNVSQVAGVAVNTGNGTASGSQRVTIASDNSTVPVALGSSTVATYSASKNGLTVVAAATDIFTVTGSGTKTVRIKRIRISGTQSISGEEDVLIVKRSTANTGGTSSAVTIVPNDSNDAAGTATVLSYTANPTLGTLVGSVRSTKMIFGITTSGNNGQFTDTQRLWEFGGLGQKEIILRGTSQVLAINLNGQTMAGSSINIDVEYTEE